MKRKIIFSVTTDITFDQRMIRICNTLHENDFDVLLVGRKKKGSLPLNLNFNTSRLNCVSQKGKLFYIEYNIRLFFYLLFKNTDILCAIDLDSIVPNYLVSRIKRTPLVYDSHEYFTEVIEVANRPKIKRFWERIEEWIIPNLTYAYTVGKSIADIYTKKYGVDFKTIRNIRSLSKIKTQETTSDYIIYAGALNAGRGLEETIDAIKDIDFKLMICGEGDLSLQLRQQVKELGIEEKVEFKGFVQPDLLQTYIEQAYAGILVLKNEGLSYYLSLANKFFDYLHAGIPQIVCDFPEYKALNDQYKVAVHADITSESIAKSINQLIEDKTLYNQLKANTLLAREELNWQKESRKLIDFYKSIK